MFNIFYRNVRWFSTTFIIYILSVSVKGQYDAVNENPTSIFDYLYDFHKDGIQYVADYLNTKVEVCPYTNDILTKVKNRLQSYISGQDEALDLINHAIA